MESHHLRRADRAPGRGRAGAGSAWRWPRTGRVPLSASSCSTTLIDPAKDISVPELAPNQPAIPIGKESIRRMGRRRVLRRCGRRNRLAPWQRAVFQGRFWRGDHGCLDLRVVLGREAGPEVSGFRRRVGQSSQRDAGAGKLGRRLRHIRWRYAACRPEEVARRESPTTSSWIYEVLWLVNRPGNRPSHEGAAALAGYPPRRGGHCPCGGARGPRRPYPCLGRWMPAPRGLGAGRRARRR
jgi:hypothetical protein